MKFNIFGSEDSIDHDVMCFVDELPKTKQECHDLCKSFERRLRPQLTSPMIHPGRPINVNLAKVENGIITEVFKGTPDECNNSILYTYGLHKQYHLCPIETKVKRNKEWKYARSLRIILTMLSRTEKRKEVKLALSGTAENKISTLRNIDFVKLGNFTKNNLSYEDIIKNIAFQIGQCMGLISDLELYTKTDISRAFFSLKNCLRRRPNPTMINLNLRYLLIRLTNNYKNLEQLDENLYEMDKR